MKTRYDDLLDDLPNDDSRNCAPSFELFLQLPAVKALSPLAFNVSEATVKDVLAKLEQQVDQVKEEMATYALDVRFKALKLILAVTTEMTEKEIEDLDPDVLAEEAYDDEFFERPSSWLSCRHCGRHGPLLDLLKHLQTGCHKAHWWTFRFPMYLPVEVACASSAIFDLLKVDMDEPMTPKELNEKLEGHSLTWENAPRWKGAQRTGWRYLVRFPFLFPFLFPSLR